MKTPRASSLGLLSLIALTSLSGPGAAGNDKASPETRRHVIAANGVVAAAHPLAAQAGLEVLQGGGNAVDAAIATALTLGVVEPNASGLGGGGFALVYIAGQKKSYVVDFRETAPAKVRSDTYQPRQKGKAAFNPSATGYQAVAVPGELRGLEMLHKMFGTKKWAELLQPAIQRAEAGVVVTETLSQVVTDEYDRLEKAPAMPWLQKNFYKDALPVQPGDVVKNPELVQTLKKIAVGGADVFYKGELASAIVKEFAEQGGGWITREDLANYKALLREPLTGNYRGCTVVTLPPPSSGGLALIELLNILEGFDLAKLGLGSPDYYHAIIEAQKLAFADRAEYIADPAFATVPVAGLLDKKYAEERRGTIDMQRTKKASPGAPSKHESGSTTSFSVADKDGNLATITQTINHFMGAGVVPEGTGILLNDEMDDFDLKPGSLNRPAPAKRPLSSIAPIILLKDEKPLLIAGTPGATRIITAMANIVVHVIDLKEELQPAILAPRFHNGNTAETAIEARFSPELLRALESRGHKFGVKKEMDLYFGGAQGVMYRSDGKLLGMGDPRRDGVALGY